jgi:tetratricopeptide (TPR) repeat protein
LSAARTNAELAGAGAASELSPARQQVALARNAHGSCRHEAAARHFAAAAELAADDPESHAALGVALQACDEPERAAFHYRRSLELNPARRGTRRALINLLVVLDRWTECLDLWRVETPVSTEAMRSRDLSLAGKYARLLAAVRWGSRWYPGTKNATTTPLEPVPVTPTIPKLEHDIEQLVWLRDHGILARESAAIIDGYRRLIEKLSLRNEQKPAARDDREQDLLDHVFNRILHVRDTPRLTHALSGTWEPAAVERAYMERAPGIVVIDDFLSPDALRELRLFCLASTVWSANRYAHGRLGAFFHEGFNCPLLLQIAEDLRNALPRVIGERYSLRQLWGYKNGAKLPPNSAVHADFAAVNVNFWITPTEANLDANTGGLIVYDVDAPQHWNFQTYNGRPDMIHAYLVGQQARSVTIPYRENRAVIFNSDLFHGTAELNFRPGYENRRINITMLYGERADDVHYRGLGRAGETPRGTGAVTPSWRSAAFARNRRR